MMQITRERLGRIIREEAARLQEAGRASSSDARGARPSKKNFKPVESSTVDEIGSYDATEASEQLERFGEAISTYADLITKGVIASGNVRERSAMATLKSELKDVSSKLKQLAATWDRLIVGPADETDELQSPRGRR